MLKKMGYFAVFASLIGAEAVSVNLGFMQLSAFRVIMAALAAVMLVNWIRSKEKINFKGNRESRYSLVFMMIWLIYSAVSVAWVKDFSNWFKAVYFIGLGTASAVVFINIFKKTAEILNCFRIMAWVAIAHNLVGWYEIITRHYWFLDDAKKIAKYKIKIYPVSTFNNANDFALFTLILIIILYVCIVNAKYTAEKCVYMAEAASCLYLLKMTQSRANFIGLAAALGVFAFLSIRKKRGRPFGVRKYISKATETIRGKIVGIGAVLIIVSAAALLIKLNLNLNSASSSDSERINLIKNGFIFLGKTFGFGTGAGNIEYWMGHYGVYKTNGIVNMHNWWMEILTGYGVLIFVLYIVFYFRMFKSMYNKFISSDNIKETSIALGIMCCMTAFTFGSVSSSSNISREWLWVFWAVCIAVQGIFGREKY